MRFSRSLLFGALFAGACVPEDEATSSFGEPWGEPDLAAPVVPSPYSFDLEATPLVVGNQATLSVSGAPAGKAVYFVLTTNGLGPGQCLQAMHGTCLDIKGSPSLLGKKTASAQGTASLSFTVPTGVSASYVGIQAVVLGGTAKTSNAVGRWIRSAGTALDPNVDTDQDGFTIAEGDCHEGNGAINPLATDIVGDGIDQNCDNADGYDGDGDGFAATWSSGTDCDDNDASRYPLDLDEDGVTACDDDCDDFDDTVYPGAEEVCDGADSDCDGRADKTALGIDACGVVDIFDAGGDGSRADVLFLVDNSCSMTEEQGRLAAAAGDFLSPLWSVDADVHLGVITTDMVNPLEQGRLQGAGAHTYLDNRFDYLTTVNTLALLFEQGIAGDFNERGRDAIHEALVTHRYTANLGFYRDDADLVIVALSDENDYSTTWDVIGFSSWLSTLKSNGRSVRYHSIVGPNPNCVTAAETGWDYLLMSSNFGGYTASVCDPDYYAIMGDIGDGIANNSIPSWYELSDTPLLATLVVVVVEPNGTSYAVASGDLTYRAQYNDFQFDTPPPAGSTIYVSYQAAP